MNHHSRFQQFQPFPPPGFPHSAPTSNGQPPVTKAEHENTIVLDSPALSLPSERTRQIVWALPAEPRFRVTPGGLRRDWHAARQVAGGLGIVGLFILALARWPHHTPPAVPAQNNRSAYRVPLPSTAFTPHVATGHAAALPLNATSAPRCIAPAAPTAGHASLLPNPY